MRTVQEYLREADRERLLDSVAYDAVCDTGLLLEYPNKTIAQIQDASKRQMNDLIEYLLSLEPVPTDCMVLYMTEADSFDREFNNEYKLLHLINLNEIRKDIYAPSYGFDLSDWAETLGYLVAENKLTQDYMIELLTQYLHEISFFGADPEQHSKEVEKVCADLDQSMKEIKEGKGKGRPAEEVFKELAMEHGWPIDEKDEKQEAMQEKITEAGIKYNRYCIWRERSRILKSFGETAPEFEKDECDS